MTFVDSSIKSPLCVEGNRGPQKGVEQQQLYTKMPLEQFTSGVGQGTVHSLWFSQSLRGGWMSEAVPDLGQAHRSPLQVLREGNEAQ